MNGKPRDVYRQDFRLTELVVCLKILLSPTLEKVSPHNYFGAELRGFKHSTMIIFSDREAKAKINPHNWDPNSHIEVEYDYDTLANIADGGNPKMKAIRIRQIRQEIDPHHHLVLALKVENETLPMKFSLIEDECSPVSFALFKEMMDVAQV